MSPRYRYIKSENQVYKIFKCQTDWCIYETPRDEMTENVNISCADMLGYYYDSACLVILL